MTMAMKCGSTDPQPFRHDMDIQAGPLFSMEETPKLNLDSERKIKLLLWRQRRNTKSRCLVRRSHLKKIVLFFGKINEARVGDLLGDKFKVPQQLSTKRCCISDWIFQDLWETIEMYVIFSNETVNVNLSSHGHDNDRKKRHAGA